MGWKIRAVGHYCRPRPSPYILFKIAYLDQVSWQSPMPIAIIEGKGRGETWHWDANLDTCADGATPGILVGR